ncbi:MAG: CpsD/CapB family tyrosine-protein kinase [Ruminococcus sp.]
MNIKMPILSKKDKKGSYSSYSSKTSYSNSSDPSGKFAIIEGFKIARTNIQFSLSASNENCFAVTSWSKGEGKSTATSNIAISFAKMEKKVILLDCDLRRPNIHNLLKIDNAIGLTSVLCNENTFDKVVQKDVLPNLDVLTVGTIPPNPSELIASDNFSKLIKTLKEEYDYVIMDTAPIGIVTDALLVKDLVAGYLVIVREGVTTHGDIQNFISSCKTAGAKVMGFLKVGCNPGNGKAGKYRKYNRKYGSYDYYRYY